MIRCLSSHITVWLLCFITHHHLPLPSARFENDHRSIGCSLSATSSSLSSSWFVAAYPEGVPTTSCVNDMYNVIPAYAHLPKTTVFNVSSYPQPWNATGGFVYWTSSPTWTAGQPISLYINDTLNTGIRGFFYQAFDQNYNRVGSWQTGPYPYNTSFSIVPCPNGNAIAHTIAVGKSAKAARPRFLNFTVTISTPGIGPIFFAGVTLTGRTVWYLYNMSTVIPEVEPAGTVIDTTQLPTPPPAVKYYTSAEVALHNSSKDCWTIYNQSVYNQSMWVPHHPGTTDPTVMSCGGNGTLLYMLASLDHNWTRIGLYTAYLGEVKVTAPVTTSPTSPSPTGAASTSSPTTTSPSSATPSTSTPTSATPTTPTSGVVVSVAVSTVNGYTTLEFALIVVVVLLGGMLVLLMLSWVAHSWLARLKRRHDKRVEEWNRRHGKIEQDTRTNSKEDEEAMGGHPLPSSTINGLAQSSPTFMIQTPHDNAVTLNLSASASSQKITNSASSAPTPSSSSNDPSSRPASASASASSPTPASSTAMLAAPDQALQRNREPSSHAPPVFHDENSEPFN